MKAYISNGILLNNRDCAVVYGNDTCVQEIHIYHDTVIIKCELLTSVLEMDIDVPNKKANVFLHFDHPEFDPTANTEIFNYVELEFRYDIGWSTDEDDNLMGKYCKDLHAKTINRNYKLEHLSFKTQVSILHSITKVIDDYLKEQKFKD